MNAAATTTTTTTTTTSVDNPFGEFLRGVMASYQCETVADLVRLVDVDQSSMSRYLSGQSEPTLANLRKIATRLSRSLGDVMVAAGMVTREELGQIVVAPKAGSAARGRLAPVLAATQDLLDDPASTDAEKQFLLRAIRGLLNMTVEARRPVIAEPAMRRRKGGA